MEPGQLDAFHAKYGALLKSSMSTMRKRDKKREKQKSFAESMQLVFQDVYKRSVEHPELTADMLLDRTAALSYNGFVVPPNYVLYTWPH